MLRNDRSSSSIKGHFLIAEAGTPNDFLFVVIILFMFNHFRILYFFYHISVSVLIWKNVLMRQYYHNSSIRWSWNNVATNIVSSSWYFLVKYIIQNSISGWVYSGCSKHLWWVGQGVVNQKLFFFPTEFARMESLFHGHGNVGSSVIAKDLSACLVCYIEDKGGRVGQGCMWPEA